MAEHVQNAQEANPTPRLDENAACDVCGKLGAFQFGDRRVCLDCYAGCGSCCPEFGKDDDDLWDFGSTSEPSPINNWPPKNES